MHNSFGARSTLRVGTRDYVIFRLDALGDVSRLPYSLRILLENLLRHEDGGTVRHEDIEALARWDSGPPAAREIGFSPARVLLQDFTGVPALVDLAAMRDAMAELGGDPARINPLIPVELVIDHSIQVDAYGTPEAFETNVALDYRRNLERYAFLRWGQRAFANLRVVPPNAGICHQVNLEYLARVVFSTDENPRLRHDHGLPLAYPDTCVGTDSHTPMVNGLGVLAWGVGGIEAEAVMLGQPVSMLIPEVVGFRLEGRLAAGVTATDLVLTVTERLRRKGVVGKFVEFHGPGVASLALADRATLGNMAPEYGATCAIFPPDAATLDYLRFTGRSEERLALVEAYLKEQGLFHTPDAPEPVFTDTLTLDLGTVEPSVAGPGRPQDRIGLSDLKQTFGAVLPALLPTGHGLPKPGTAPAAPDTATGIPLELRIDHGAVVIAAITSCTNTSNPAVMMAAGLLAKKARERGLVRPPWVKTSLAPGSRVVTDYFREAGLDRYLDELGFATVGYGCTTCIGNSGPLPEAIAAQIWEQGLVACAVLSGNRNFEGRINPDVRANFLMSPPLVVAFALVGRIDWNPDREPLGVDNDGRPVFLRDIWPAPEEIEAAIRSAIRSDLYRTGYGRIFAGDARWQALPVPGEDRFTWDERSTYVRRPPYFEAMATAAPAGVADILGARVLAFLGDSVTTDHISPAGTIASDSPAGQYLENLGIPPPEFNSYGARRGNHEVMVRGTFANGRIRNRLAPGTEGGYTTFFPEGRIMAVYDAAMGYRRDGTPLGVLAGKEYGAGSSRDWAAKGPYLQGVRFVLAESYERIHRSNLVGMGILPLQFRSGDNATTLGLTGRETFDVTGLEAALGGCFTGGCEATIRAMDETGQVREFRATIRLDTPREALYYLNGGVLPCVLRQFLGQAPRPAEVPGALATAAQPVPGARPLPGAVEESSKDSFPASDPPGY
jgi:aconitate hydratase